MLNRPIYVATNEDEDPGIQTPNTEYPGPPQEEPTDPTAQ